MIEEIDKTEYFFEFCKSLQPGELCHVKNFDLQDVMTAIELMDPKMDSRMKINRKIIYLKEAIDLNLLPMKDDIEPKLLVGIIDETLASFVNWLKGDTLGQTVFINMYMHCTSSIENKALRGFCEALKTVILFVKFVIFKACVAEEEDFYPNTSKMPLDDCLPETRITGMLKEVDDELCKTIKSESDSESNLILTCLQYRVRFIRNLVLWCSSIKKHLEIGNNKLAKETYQEANRCLSIMKEMMDKMIETICYGEQAGEGKHKPMEKDYGLIGFEPYLNQPLLPPAIPRCADIEDREPAFGYLKELLARFQQILKVLQTDLTSDIFSAWVFLKQFGTYGCEGSSKSCALSRSLMLSFYLNQFSFPNTDFNSIQSVNIKVDMLKTSLQSFLKLTCWSEIESLIKSDEKLLLFLSACAENICQIPVTYSLNRSRQRTRLELIIDANWELYEDCFKVDRLLRTFIGEKNFNTKRIKDIPPLFSSFVAVIQFRVMLDYVISGFELDLYAPHELLSVYFILSENILKFFISHLTEIECIQSREQTRLNRLTNKKSRRQYDRDININLQQLQQYRTKLQAYYHLSQAYLFLFCSLTEDNRITRMSEAANHYSNQQLCYIKRFETLVSRGWFPETASFMKFQEKIRDLLQLTDNTTTTTEIITQLYDKAAQQFDIARKFIDQQLPEIFTESTSAQLSNIAKNNWIVSRLLSKQMKPGQRINLNFDVSIEKAFPIIKIQ